MSTRLEFVIEFGLPDSIITTTKNLVRLFALESGGRLSLSYNKQNISIVNEFFFPPGEDNLLNPQRLLMSSFAAVFAAVCPFID